jgi:hypothetical protein
MNHFIEDSSENQFANGRSLRDLRAVGRCGTGEPTRFGGFLSESAESCDRFEARRQNSDDELNRWIKLPKGPAGGYGTLLRWWRGERVQSSPAAKPPRCVAKPISQRSRRTGREKALFSAQFLHLSEAPSCLMVKGVKHLFSQRAALIHGCRPPFVSPSLANPHMREGTPS